MDSGAGHTLQEAASKGRFSILTVITHIKYLIHLKDASLINNCYPIIGFHFEEDHDLIPPNGRHQINQGAHMKKMFLFITLCLILILAGSCGPQSSGEATVTPRLSATSIPPTPIPPTPPTPTLTPTSIPPTPVDYP